MDSVNKIKIEEISILPEVKVEPPKHHSELIENVSSDATEIEEEFKIQIKIAGQSLEENSIVTGNTQCFETVLVKEEFEIESTERQDDQTELFDDNFEIGTEFETDDSVTKKNFDDPAEAEQTVQIYSLKHCTACDESWNLSEVKKVKTCLKCETVLKFQCKRCSKIFPRISTLNRHINSVCIGKPKFYCHHCSYKTYFHHQLTGHIRAKHKLVQNSEKTVAREIYSLKYCTNCDKSWKLPEIKREKFCLECKTILKFQCKKCSKIFTLLSSLHRHFDNICIGKPFFCRQCTYKTYLDYQLTEHIRAKHELSQNSEKSDEIYLMQLKYCTNCDESWKLSEKKGEKACHRCKTIFKYQCKKCSKVYNHPPSLYTHIKSVCSEKLRFNCDHCNHQAHFKYMLGRHIQQKHKFLFQNSETSDGNEIFGYCVKCYEYQNCSTKKCTTCLKCQSNLVFKLTDHTREKPKLVQNSEKTDKIYLMQLKYCTNCDESWKLSEKKGETACHRCKTIFKYQCKKCSKVYNHSPSLFTHIKSVCTEKPRFNCDHCDYQTYFKYILGRHIQQKHKFLFLNSETSSKNEIYGYCVKCCEYQNCPTKKCTACLKCQSNLAFICKNCRKEFESRKSLQNHIYICNLAPKCCSYCDFKTKRTYLLVEHIQAMHPPKDPNSNKCTLCGRGHATKSALRQHSKICGKTKNVYLFCAQCKYRTLHQKNLALHVTSKHLIGDSNIITCMYCGTFFTLLSGLKRHLKYNCRKLKKKLKPPLIIFSCDLCTCKYKFKQSLIRHIKTIHSFDALNLIKCGKCNKSFSALSSLRKHSMICGKIEDSERTGKFLFCDHCSYKTTGKKSLESHLQSKHMSFIFKCTSCRKNFASELGLHEHTRRYHTDSLKMNRSLHCDHCKYKTKFKHYLVDHIWSNHLGETSKCGVCGKSFSSRRNLNNHVRMYCSQKPKKFLFCEYCEYKSLRKSHLADHIRAKHLKIIP